jgi:5-oxopent-3-ene-1,2,5-tricarboxylate decarboxylase/2-hydroxyhepta-2,4-diene-1,7-dioate isomerase
MIDLDFMPYRLTGTIYGSLLNHRAVLATLGAATEQPPYRGAPKAPVLYLKPRNTLARAGDPVKVPHDVPALEAAASLGIVIGRTVCRVTAEDALAHVAGYVLVNDVSIPHDSYHRPSVRLKARDGFLPLGSLVARRDEIPNPDALAIRTYVDGHRVQTASTEGLVRPVARLLSDVSEFMTLAAGDILTVGALAAAPRVQAGQTVVIEADALGSLGNPFVGGGP